MQYDVLISYSAQERGMVERLAAYLEYYNIKCFVAHRDIPADVAWANGIAAAIGMSRMAVVVYSDSYNSAPWLNRELASVGASGIPILTMCLSAAPYSEEKADYLRGTICVNATGNAEDSFPVLYEEICNMFGMPIDVALHPSQVLKAEDNGASEPVEVEKAEPEKADNKEARAEGKKQKVQPQPEEKKSHHLFRAFLLGIALTLAAMALLEMLLE